MVTSTLQSADWNGSEILGPYSAEAIRDLKASVDGDLYVSGSATLVRAMLADGSSTGSTRSCGVVHLTHGPA